jgi:hypothetical protein
MGEHGCCEKCRFWRKLDLVQSVYHTDAQAPQIHGECRKLPPVVVPVGNSGGFRTVFPTSCSGADCGEFKPKDAEDVKT